MKRIIKFLLPCALLVGSWGCNCGDGPGGRRDAGVDAGEPDAGPIDSGAPPDAGRDAGGRSSDRSASFVTSGGANASSPRYRMRFSVGAPQPTGESAGSGERILLGPAATPR